MSNNPGKEAKLELEEDRLTTLPDSILSHILSFLPTNEAVQTLLIQRFGTLWTSLPNLDFDDYLFTHIWPPEGEENTGFFPFLHNVLARHQRPTLDKFRLQINTVLYQEIESEHFRQEIDSSLAFALRKRVKFLEFGFGMVEPDLEIYKLPFSEFDGTYLVELKLTFVEMELQTRVQMGSLRVLKLVYVTLSDEVLSEIIRGCPLLKELEISNCFDLSEVSSPTLEKLKLDRECIAWDEIMRINCPKLLTFIYSGCVNGLEIINLSSLVELTFHLSFTITELEFSSFTQFLSVLTKLLHAKTVSLSCEFATVLFYSMLKHLPHRMLDWNQVELSIWLTNKGNNHIPGLCQLLKSSPDMKKLVLNVTFWHSDFLEAIESELGSYSLDKEEHCWNSLKTVIIHNISMSLYSVIVRLVKILLMSSPVLDELVIYYKANDQTSELQECLMTSEQLAEFSVNLPTFAKASPTAKVLLL